MCTSTPVDVPDPPFRFFEGLVPRLGWGLGTRLETSAGAVWRKYGGTGSPKLWSSCSLGKKKWVIVYLAYYFTDSWVRVRTYWCSHAAQLSWEMVGAVVHFKTNTWPSSPMTPYCLMSDVPRASMTQDPVPAFIYTEPPACSSPQGYTMYQHDRVDHKLCSYLFFTKTSFLIIASIAVSDEARVTVYLE